MRNVLIMGINGTFGGEMAKTLLNEGYNITAFLRDPKKLSEKFKNIKTIQGDVQDLHSIRAACKNIDIIVYGVNPANYDWREKVIPYLDNVAKVTEEQKLTLIFPGNVYVFDPSKGPEFNENSPHEPLTEKGHMRQVMEKRLQQASKHGAKILILRMGDFIAPDAKSAWLPQLIKKNRQGYTLLSPGPAELTHSWAYVPDAASVACKLLNKSDQLPDFSVFHFKGYRASIKDMAKIIEEVTGEVVKMKGFPWWLIKLAAPFFTVFRGLLEMSYLWKTEVNLSDKKLKTLLGDDYKQTELATSLIDSKLITSPNQSQLVKTNSN